MKTDEGTDKERFSVRKRLESFEQAFNGLKLVLKNEHNARLHLLAAILVVAFGFIFNLKREEWIAIVISIGFVFAMELINTAIEHVCNFVCPDKNEAIKKIKDISAAAVLVAAMVSLGVGVLVFGPKIASLLQ